jgi:NAD-dependent deacetylase
VENAKSTAEVFTIADAAALAGLLRDNQPCVVLTGAGVSTESGIPDFRSPTGIWAEFDPAEYASLPAFRADPAKVWRFYKRRIAMLTEAEPNPAHLALAALERAGLVEAVLTQNIDQLHERAGSSNVVEVPARSEPPGVRPAAGRIRGMS